MRLPWACWSLAQLKYFIPGLSQWSVMGISKIKAKTRFGVGEFQFGKSYLWVEVKENKKSNCDAVTQAVV